MTITEPAFVNATCPLCGGRFVCGAVAGLSCWCLQQPALLRVPDPAAGCYCPTCLQQVSILTRPGAPAT
ncbi:MAG: cysteine-rich CWC family protein [Candidatus Accumulibacter sp.]|uniref:cysteine-rich CWC family protein n=1 Tax=Accumulibacter sp. TaxID=2053492 RepID=UPI001A5AB82C|nr:cysteine-rich CWC family protein [Accumulibacter sp.]MBL8393773.1 cysteine-rich CWC family protein [Accumulibacter sp.]